MFNVQHPAILMLSHSSTNTSKNTTMKLVLAALLAGTAAAFAPAAKTISTTALAASSPYENEPGVIFPTGFFDPLGLSTKATPEQFARWRTVELKHGRISMLAVLGYVVPEFFRWPGAIDLHGTMFADIPNGIDAVFALPPVGLAQMFAIIGLVDNDGLWGNYDVGKPDLAPEVLEKRLTQELQHGRLAMIAILELFHHDIVTDGEPLVQGFPFLYN
jgi:light-harvesting complex I chlorophyll a/b binding protein 1